MKYDIVIVGGGMVGAALATALKNTPLRIALVDSSPLVSEDSRLIGLNYASYKFFEKVEIWPALASFATAIQQVHVSHRGHFGITRLTAKEQGLPALGYVIPAQHINTGLYAALTSANNIDIIRPATLHNLTQHHTGVTLTLEIATQQTTLNASTVIGADGTHSSVRQLLGISTETRDYQQSALVTITELQRHHRNIAYERFQDAGAIAMLPLTEQQAATIWTAPHTLINHLMHLPDDLFLQALQTSFGYRLGKFIRTQKRAIYPLKNVVARQQKQQNVLLIGNAAHTLHPIAAQGLNLALYEVNVIAEHLIQQKGSLENLPNYLPQQNFSAQLSHHLSRLFSNDFFMLSAARSFSMIGLDIFPALKRRFIQQAIGNTCKK